MRQFYSLQFGTENDRTWAPGNANLSATKYALLLSRADLRMLTGHADLNQHLTLMHIRAGAVCFLCQEDEETPLARRM